MCQGAQVQVGASGAVYLSGVCTWGVLVLAASRIGRLQIEFMSSYNSDHDPNVAFHGRWFQPRVQHVAIAEQVRGEMAQARAKAAKENKDEL